MVDYSGWRWGGGRGSISWLCKGILSSEGLRSEKLVFRWNIPVCGEYNFIQLTVKHTRNKIKLYSLSYLFRICTPDDGSLEPKHVAPCLLLSKIINILFYFLCFWRLIVSSYEKLVLYWPERICTHAHTYIPGIYAYRTHRLTCTNI